VVGECDTAKHSSLKPGTVRINFGVHTARAKMVSISLGRIYKRCTSCGTHIPRRVWDKENNRGMTNEKDICNDCENEKTV